MVKIDSFRITAHDGEIVSESTATASSGPTLDLSGPGATATTITAEPQGEVNSLKCDE